jgi:hypothetical protein
MIVKRMMMKERVVEYAIVPTMVIRAERIRVLLLLFHAV